jgi:hypothetical protein
MHATCLAHLTIDLISVTIFRKEVKIIKIAVQFSVAPCYFLRLDPERPILLNTFF